MVVVVVVAAVVVVVVVVPPPLQRQPGGHIALARTSSAVAPAGVVNMQMSVRACQRRTQGANESTDWNTYTTRTSEVVSECPYGGAIGGANMLNS
jgi:hypothetical protein